MTAESWELLELYRDGRSGLGGAGPLPEAGGLLDQSAYLTAAFAIMGAAEAELKKDGA